MSLCGTVYTPVHEDIFLDFLDSQRSREKGCSAGCQREFVTSNFLLTHEKPHLFVTSQWSARCGCTDLFYLLWRILTSVTLVAITGFSGVMLGYGARWLTYLTNWSFLCLTSDALLQCALCCYAFWLQNKYDKRIDEIFAERGMPWYLQVSWVLTNISSASGLVVTLLYYATLYSPEWETVESFLVHSVNSMYILTNLWITARPVRVYHMFHTWIFLGTYMLFSAAYTVPTGIAMYKVLDWRGDPLSAGMFGFLGVIMAPLIVWPIIYGIYRLRLVISNALGAGDNKNNNNDEKKEMCKVRLDANAEVDARSKENPEEEAMHDV